MEQNNPTSVTTGQVRLSYAHLYQPYAQKPGQEPKYSVTLLIPKSDIATKQRIDMAIQAAIQAGVPKVWSGVRPPQLAIPIHDGDGPRPSDGMPFGEECRGHWVMTASNKNQQAIVDINLNPIINQTEVYSGMYGRVNINFFPYNNTKKGVGCSLGPVQKIADGEPLSAGAVSPEAAFGAAPIQQQSYPQQPVQQPVYQQPAYPQQPAQQMQPTYQPTYPAQQGYPQQPVQQPVYQASVQQSYPQQPVQQPVQQQAIDPITGAPVIPGGVMGI